MNDTMLLVLAFAATVAVASGLAALLFRAGRRTIEDRLRERETSLAKTESELTAERERRFEAESRLAAERAGREEERRAAAERLETMRQAQADFLKEMDALSRRALDRNNKTFLELARTQFEGLVGKADERAKLRAIEMGKLVEPLGKSLEAVQAQIREVEKSRTDAYSALTEQVKGLSEAQLRLQKEAGNLVTALRRPQVRGRWGEIQLRRVVELAGMEAFCDFDEQVTARSEDGRLRPDMIVRLPGGRIIVVDAKVPLEAYLEAAASEDPAVVRPAMARHVAQIREHVRKLGGKAYQDQFQEAPDMVLMFLPGESFYYAALEEDPHLLEYGIGSNVIIATPMTLIALLKAVAYGWRQEAMADNARRIMVLGQELYDRLATLADSFQKVGSGLAAVVGNYNRAVGSLEGRVLVSARRFKDLGTVSAKDLPEIEPVDATPRLLQASELRATPGSAGGEGAE